MSGSPNTRGRIDRNVVYVREHDVSELLNDMVLALLAERPDDALSGLIRYLERRVGPEAASPSHSAATASPAPPAAAAPAAVPRAPATPPHAAAPRPTIVMPTVAIETVAAAAPSGASPKTPPPNAGLVSLFAAHAVSPASARSPRVRVPEALREHMRRRQSEVWRDDSDSDAEAARMVAHLAEDAKDRAPTAVRVVDELLDNEELALSILGASLHGPNAAITGAPLDVIRLALANSERTVAGARAMFLQHQALQLALDAYTKSVGEPSEAAAAGEAAELLARASSVAATAARMHAAIAPHAMTANKGAPLVAPRAPPQPIALPRPNDSEGAPLDGAHDGGAPSDATECDVVSVGEQIDAVLAQLVVHDAFALRLLQDATRSARVPPEQLAQFLALQESRTAALRAAFEMQQVHRATFLTPIAPTQKVNLQQQTGALKDAEAAECALRVLTPHWEGATAGRSPALLLALTHQGLAATRAMQHGLDRISSLN